MSERVSRDSQLGNAALRLAAATNCERAMPSFIQLRIRSMSVGVFCVYISPPSMSDTRRAAVSGTARATHDPHKREWALTACLGADCRGQKAGGERGPAREQEEGKAGG